MKRIVVVADAQIPYANPRQVSALARFIRTTQPDDVYCVGDVADLPMVSRWTRGRRGEHDGNISEHRDQVCRFLERVMPNGGHLKEGNHDRRIEMYIDNYASALSPLQELKMETFFRLGDLGITLHRDLWEYTPGHILAHGDEGSLSATGGMTAMGLAKKLGMSVTCSHTHRQGIIFQGSSLHGVTRSTIFGHEVGHTMNLHDAQYLRSGVCNWVAGFGVLDIFNNGRVTPHNVQMSVTGSFTWEGQTWEDGKIRKGSTKGATLPRVA